MKGVLLISLLAVTVPTVSAALGCGDVKYGSNQYRAGMQQLSKQANLAGGTYTKYHERVVNNFCNGDADDTKKLVDLGYVSAQEVSSIQRILQSNDTRSESRAPAVTASAKTSNPGDLPFMTKAINGAFIQWSNQWMFDRYIPDSTVITENQIKNDVYVVRGTFKFGRGASVNTIPFASALQRQEANWLVSSLCYNDTTTGMTDCANSRTNAAARQFMSAVVVVGLLSAMGNGSSGPSNAGGSSNTLNEERARRESEQNRENSARVDAQKNADWWDKMNRP
jgi:hypothetical protein